MKHRKRARKSDPTGCTSGTGPRTGPGSEGAGCPGVGASFELPVHKLKALPEPTASGATADI